MSNHSNEIILEVENLYKRYPIKGGFFRRTINSVKAVSDVSFQLRKGETLGLVGESGCGKSTLGRVIMALEEASAGSVKFMGQDLHSLGRKDLRNLRKDFQMIFQDPFSSLNPRMSVFKLLAEPLKNFYPEMGKKEIIERVKELMNDVGLRQDYAGRYPHEFSGGQRQRISIGRALASAPKLLICDEPVSALDVSIQAQILNLLLKLQEKYHFSYIFISHDLHVVRHISTKIAVMYLGKFVEVGNSDQICQNPKHPYTKALLSAVPVAKVGEKEKRTILSGDVPSPLNPPSGCYFHPRCPIAIDDCRSAVPILSKIGDLQEVSCIRQNEL